MARSAGQNLKLLYLMDYLLQSTDAEHPATVRELIAHLASRGVSAERKSIYDDMEALRLYGLDVEQTALGRKNGYYVASRAFELPELKLLVDSVQSSKFITVRKTNELIRKIETLACRYDAARLHRQVFVANRVKTMNESIYYNVDAVHAGISENKKIRFRYFEYTVTKERRYRHGGAYYVVSPYALTWDDENYYLIAHDGEHDEIRHYRVDKMTHIATVDAPREGLEAFRASDAAQYARKVFGMFSGREEHVCLRFAAHLVGAVLDRLGQDASIVPDGEEHFTVSADVAVSPQFFAWVTGFGSEARILSPQSVVEAFREHIAAVSAQYEED